MNSLTLRDRPFEWGARTYLMGILNVTPDSFSDGGEFNSVASAIPQAEKLAAAGADTIDVGGQSTRPGAETITLEEELQRVIPVVESLRSRLDLPISVDTTRSQVAAAALEAGADLLNDISGGRFDPDIFAVAARFDVPIVLMHSRGTPETMQSLTQYDNLVEDVRDGLAAQINAATAAGCDRSKVIVDPGIGFAKTAAQNLLLLRELDKLRALGCPILVGPSRKSFIGRILGDRDPKDRIWGTGAACAAAIARGADILRVHDVAEMADICRVSDAILREAIPGSSIPSGVPAS